MSAGVEYLDRMLARYRRGDRLKPHELARVNAYLDTRSIERRPALHRDGWSRADGTNPRATGRSPRQNGTNPRALGTSPRGWLQTALRARRAAWARMLERQAAGDVDGRSCGVEECHGGWLVDEATGELYGRCSGYWHGPCPTCGDGSGWLLRRRRGGRLEALELDWTVQLDPERDIGAELVPCPDAAHQHHPAA